MRYKALILDHDDTVVDSTKSIHYPAFLETLRTLRPSESFLSYADFTHHCHEYGFQDLCDRRYGFTSGEMEIEYRIWKSYTTQAIPEPFEGWSELFNRFRNLGGQVVVISHSERKEIERDYHKHFGFIPELVYGWELGPEQRKPNPYPLADALSRLALNRRDVLVVDDMRLGQIMAHTVGVDFAWAGWTHENPVLIETLKNSSDRYFASLDELIEYMDF